jgi:hypothetical protein
MVSQSGGMGIVPRKLMQVGHFAGHFGRTVPATVQAKNSKNGAEEPRWLR